MTKKKNTNFDLLASLYGLGVVVCGFLVFSLFFPRVATISIAHAMLVASLNFFYLRYYNLRILLGD